MSNQNEQDNRQMTPISIVISQINDRIVFAEKMMFMYKRTSKAFQFWTGVMAELEFLKSEIIPILPKEKELLKSFYMEGVREYAGMYDSIDYEKRAETEYNSQFKTHE